jgi:hypothetical protein
MGNFNVYYGTILENSPYVTQKSINGTTFKDGIKINKLENMEI